ncbi:MAG TPA: hypothetical protein PKB06_06745, partial [Actinotalea sp.]|nr:hypothetical protein [Actinotalea sp.]
MPDEPTDALVAIARDLYGHDAAELVVARDAAARAALAAGDRELAAQVRALRRPSAAAAALNLVVRESPGAVTRLVAVGAALGQAQADTLAA